MTHDVPPHILARLEIGFRTDAARLAELELDLTKALERARQFGKEHGSPDDWNSSWHRQWDNVEARLRRLRALVNEMHAASESSARDRFDKALAAWDAFQIEDAKLVEGIGAIRAQANGLSAAVRKDWNSLARTLEPQLETIHAFAEALRIKLELLQEHSKEAVDQLVQDFLARLPSRAPVDGMDAAWERGYQQAFAEIQREHHRFMGFMDVVKALFLWVETPGERVHKNRSLRVDET